MTTTSKVSNGSVEKKILEKIKKTESDNVTVVTTKAEGEKCTVCWKISKNGCERHPV
jgi:hypothetical protein